MDRDEYYHNNVRVALTANAIELLPLEAMIEMQNRAEALGPLLDPTAYRDKADEFHVDKERTRILHTAQAALKSLRERYEASHR